MQLRTSKTIASFHENFKKKFNFEEYTDKARPVLFFGLYGKNDWKEIANHTGGKIIWFAGSDSSILLTEWKEGRTDLSFLNGATIVSESDWISRDLDEMGLNYKKISLLMDDLYKWKACPLGTALYWYRANTSKHGKDLCAAVRRAIPDLEIITNDLLSVPKEEMPSVYAKCFAGVRPVEHDGQSQTVAEMALMGRVSLYNGSGPFSCGFSDINSLIEHIKELRCGYNEKVVAKRSLGYFGAQEAKWTELVLSLFGFDEILAADVFEKDPKRPGSIFRIMRKKVVNSLPDKFGTDQFERPYISKMMEERGLDSLITRKKSGFFALEFKNDGNKGYGDFSDYLTK